jgi:hypothetical protein
MTSARQIAANRRNAAKSTGPKSTQGKERSRRNALRHGLTAEKVIAALEDTEDYKAFEEAIVADFNAQSAVERELVLRLAGLLWRLRRTTRIESRLVRHPSNASHRSHRTPSSAAPNHARDLWPVRDAVRAANTQRYRDRRSMAGGGPSKPVFRQCFDPARTVLSSAGSPPSLAFDRLNRYEAMLWRQVAQTLFGWRE